MSDLPISVEELIHAELEALKVSVVMLKINERGQVANRILVHKDDIEHFKNLGYAENIKEEYDPQIGHLIEPKHIDLPEKYINFLQGLKEEKELIRKQLFKQITLWEKIKYYIYKLIGKK